MLPEINLVIGWRKKHHCNYNIYTKNGNAIESICEFHYNYANVVSIMLIT